MTTPPLGDIPDPSRGHDPLRAEEISLAAFKGMIEGIERLHALGTHTAADDIMPRLGLLLEQSQSREELFIQTKRYMDAEIRREMEAGKTEEAHRDRAKDEQQIRRKGLDRVGRQRWAMLTFGGIVAITGTVFAILGHVAGNDSLSIAALTAGSGGGSAVLWRVGLPRTPKE